jgi:hypothetical protein
MYFLKNLFHFLLIGSNIKSKKIFSHESQRHEGSQSFE